MFFFKNLKKEIQYIDNVKVIKTHKRLKTITLRVKGGVLEVLCPIFTPNFFIKKVLKSKETWIKSKINNYSSNYEITDQITQGFVKFKNTKLKIYFENGMKKKITYEKGILKFTSNFKNIEEKKKLVGEWLRKESEIYLRQRIKTISLKVGIKFKSLKIKSYTGRWGSCDSFGVICLNWKLIMLPTDVIDYVIIHELAHIIVPNHSKIFWNLVQEKDSQYLKKKNWLKENGAPLIRF